MLNHAKRELAAVGLFDIKNNTPIGWEAKTTLRILRACEVELKNLGHGDRDKIVSLATALMSKSLLSPVADGPDQWVAVEGKTEKQHVRYPAIIKDTDSKTYWIMAKLFFDGKDYKVTAESRAKVTLPWTPTEPEIIRSES
jgi:hypothetical protein